MTLITALFMIDVTPILQAVGASTVKRIQDNLASTGTNATSKTSRSVKYEVIKESDKTILRVTAKPYFMVVETGRKATPDKKPSREMIDNLGEWLRARGKDDSAKWAIAIKIQKEGSELHKKGGRKDIVSNVINEGLVLEVKAMLAKEFKKFFIENYISILTKKAS